MVIVLWILSALLSGCIFQEKTLKLTGYVEGDFQMLSPLEASRIEKILVKKGDLVQKNQSLVELNNGDLDIELEKARAVFELAELTKNRTLSLEKDGAVAKANYDEAQTAYITAKSALDMLLWQKQQRIIQAPDDGFIQEIIRDVGESVSPQLPVIYFLPKNAIKARFFIPQNFVSKIQLGQKIKGFINDKSLNMKINFISEKSEFTPPVIYTRELRGKLVYMAEASFDGNNVLKPGQPLDIEIEISNDK